MEQQKDAGAELLEEKHFAMINPWGKPVVGWKENSQGTGGIHNPMGFALARIVLWKIMNGVKAHLYDQPIIVENAGSIVIAELDGKIGLVRNFRMVGERLLPDAASNYIRQLQEGSLWRKLIETLGQWHWEAPRGLAPVRKEDESTEAFIIRTAKLEAVEEAGFKIEEARIAGRVNANPTFFAHSQYVVHAKITAMGKAMPENLEIIKGSKLFSIDEIRKLVETGEFDDGLTLAGMALCGMCL